jgi:hypothetical protein
MRHSIRGVARDLVQDRLRLFAVPQGGVLFEHLGLGRLQDAIQTAEHGERQNDATVLGRFVRASQQVGDRPNKRNFLGENRSKTHLRLSSAGEGCGKQHCSRGGGVRNEEKRIRGTETTNSL